MLRLFWRNTSPISRAQAPKTLRIPLVLQLAHCISITKLKQPLIFFGLHSLQSLHEDLCISIELDTACFVTEFAEKHKSLFACYKLINKLQSTPVPIEMTYNDDILCDPQNIADAFNKFFITVYNPPIETLVD